MMSFLHRFPWLQCLIGVVMSMLLPGYLWSLNPSSNPQKYAVQGWNTENGLPQNSVHAMLQTADGYLWMATENGLARFNGYQYRVFNKETTPRLSGNDIRCLFEDSHHVFWIGTSTGLTRMQDGVTHLFTTRDGLPSDTIRSILQAKDGTLWVLTSAGLATLADHDAATPENVHFQSDLHAGEAGASIHAMVEAPEGGVWIATDHGLFRSANGSATAPAAVVSHTEIQALTCNGTERCVFATADGIFQIRKDVVTPLAGREALPAGGVRVLVATAAGVWAAGDTSVMWLQPHGSRMLRTGAQLPGQQVEALFEDRKGAVWIGTNNGVARCWDGQINVPTVANAMAVSLFFEDSDGELWLGTETAGAFELRDRPFDLIGKAQGLGEGVATSIAAADNGSLWVGTSTDGAILINAQTAVQRTLNLKQGLASNTVLSLATNPKDRSELWIGTPDGLGHFRNGRITTLTTRDGLADDFVRSLLVAHDGAIWIGTRHGVTRLQSGHAFTWTTQQGLGSDFIGAMAEDNSGDIWIGTLNGLARFSHGAMRNYTVADGLPGSTVTALYPSKTGELWIGTNGGGLAVYNGKSIAALSSATALPKAVFAIVEDEAGSLWLSSEYGLDRVTTADLAAYRSGSHTLSVTHFGTADGLGSSGGADTGHPSAMQMEDGRLFFASRKGVITVDPALLPSDHAALPIVVEQATADDHDVTLKELASLPPGISHLAIAFAAIHLSAPQRVQYRYMLEGFDHDWIEVGTRRIAFYTNLPPGHYRFRVSARSAGGPWTDMRSGLPVGLRPRFYQTWWFRALLLCALALVLFGLYQLRLRTLNARFKAVAAERSRLAREIHDTLAQGFVAVSVRLELLSRMLHRDRLEECRQELNETRTLVQEGLEDARRSIWNLRAEGAERITLPAQLDRIVKSTIERGTDAELEVTGAYHALPSSVEDELLRMTQEAVSNALRHGDPSSINLRLVYTHDALRLEITDDGAGFDVTNAPAKESGHYGLTGLHERAEHIGAKLMIQSAQTFGTTVRIDMPTNQKQRKEPRF